MTTDAEPASFESTDHDVLAVVVAGPRGRAADTANLVRNLRTVSSLPVLLLARQMQDDVLLQELQPASSGHHADPVPLELAQQIRAILRRSPTRVLRFGCSRSTRRRVEVRRSAGQAIELSRREFDLHRVPGVVAGPRVHPPRAPPSRVALVGRVADTVDGDGTHPADPHQAPDATRPPQLARDGARHGYRFQT